jgi:hypothetical protein
MTETEVVLREIQYRAKLYSVVAGSFFTLLGLAVMLGLTFYGPGDIAFLVGLFSFFPLVYTVNTWLRMDGTSELRNLHEDYLRAKIEYEKGKS